MPVQRDGVWHLDMPLQRPALAFCKVFAVLLSLLHFLESLSVPSGYLRPSDQLVRLLVHIPLVALAGLCLSPRYGWVGPAMIVGYGASPFFTPGVNGAAYVLDAMLFGSVCGFGIGAILDWNWHFEHRARLNLEHLQPRNGRIQILRDDSWNHRAGRRLSLLVQWLALIMTIPYFLKGITDPKFVAYAPVFTRLRAVLVVQALACLCLRTGWTGPAMIVGFVAPWLISPPVDPNTYSIPLYQIQGALFGFFYGFTLDFTWQIELQFADVVSRASGTGGGDCKTEEC